MDQPGQFGGDVEAQAGAVGLAGTEILRTEEFVKNAFLVALADADASVLDGKTDALRIGLGSESDLALLGVFDGIGDEILQDFADVELAGM